MSAINAPRELIVLHWSVAAHWWLDGRFHQQAQLLRDRLRSGALGAFVLDDIDVHITLAVLRTIFPGHRSLPVTGTAGHIVANDVKAELTRLGRRRALEQMPPAPLAERALRLAQEIGISEHDAACVVLAQILQRRIDCPLIVAEDALYDRLRNQYLQLRVLWLGDYE